MNRVETLQLENQKLKNELQQQSQSDDFFNKHRHDDLAEMNSDDE